MNDHSEGANSTTAMSGSPIWSGAVSGKPGTHTSSKQENHLGCIVLRRQPISPRSGLGRFGPASLPGYTRKERCPRIEKVADRMFEGEEALLHVMGQERGGGPEGDTGRTRAPQICDRRGVSDYRDNRDATSRDLLKQDDREIRL